MHVDGEFNKMGLKMDANSVSIGARKLCPTTVQSFTLTKRRDFAETGILVSCTVFGLLAIAFLVPIIENIAAPKFLLAVTVFVFLASVSMQDFLTIRNRGETRLILQTADGAVCALETTSNAILREATETLEALGVPQRH